MLRVREIEGRGERERERETEGGRERERERAKDNEGPRSTERNRECRLAFLFSVFPLVSALQVSFVGCEFTVGNLQDESLSIEAVDLQLSLHLHFRIRRCAH